MSESEQSDDLEDGGFRAYQPGPELHEALRAAIEGRLKTAGPDFGRAQQELLGAVTGADRLRLMGAIAMYFASAEEGTNPEFNRPEGMFQHHIEIVQAVVLRQQEDAAKAGVLWDLIPAVTDAAKRLVESWAILQVRKLDGVKDEARRRREYALLRLRLNAAFLRGWAYRSRLVPMLEDLLRPLDDKFEKRRGWAPSQLPAWWEALGEAIDDRLDAHRAGVRDAVTWPVDDDWARRVEARFAALDGPPEAEVLQAARQDDDFRVGWIYHSSDLCAHEIYRFTLDELSSLLPGVDPATMRSLMDCWSMPIGDGSVPIGQLLLENPVVARPFVATGTDEWYLFCGWLLFHNAFELIEQPISDDDELFALYMQRRATFLEERTEQVLRDALPSAQIERALLGVDPADGKEYENDVLALVSSCAVVAEAKGGRFGPQARRGRGRQLRDRISELIVRPSEQARRLASRLEDSGGEFTFHRKADGSDVTCRASEIRRAIPLGVTLEPIAASLPRLADLADSGLSDEAADALAYSISLADLELVTAVLEHPSEVLHYLSRRAEIEQRTFLEGDEVDLLGLYLETGFNLGEEEFCGRKVLDVTGMSDPIDVWHYKTEAGLETDPPRSRWTRWWETVLGQVERRKNPRWAELGMTLCNVAPEQQKELEAALHQLREEVVAGKRSSADMVVFHNGPPQRRDVFVGLIATSPEREERRRQIEAAAQSATERLSLDRVTVLVWPPVASTAPYLALALLERTAAS